MSKPTNTTRIAINEIKIGSLQDRVKSFVTLDRYTPVERMVYGVVTTMVLGLVGAVLNQVLQ